MELHEVLARRIISQNIHTIIDETVKEHFGAITQEHQLTARLGQAIEQSLKSSDIYGHRITVISQDIPDKGRGSLEKKIGSDLFIGIRMQSNENDICKGIFIQSKWDKNSPPKEQERLRKQCQTMKNISDKGSFVWLYGEHGTRVIPAAEIANNKEINPLTLNAKNIRDFFDDIFDCFSGDTNYASPKIFESRGNLSQHFKMLDLPQPDVSLALTMDSRTPILEKFDM